VVGVDIERQPNYPFEFVRDDALALMSTWPWWDVPPFDAVHASPPCQAYTTLRHRTGGDYPDLVARTRELLAATGLPYVIENVVGAPLIDPVLVCGSSLGLKVRRHRLFETNWPLMVPPCMHAAQGQPVGVYGEGSSVGQVRGRKASTEAEVLEVMGMPWADRKTATQAI